RRLCRPVAARPDQRGKEDEDGPECGDQSAVHGKGLAGSSPEQATEGPAGWPPYRTAKTQGFARARGASVPAARPAPPTARGGAGRAEGPQPADLPELPRRVARECLPRLL